MKILDILVDPEEPHVRLAFSKSLRIGGSARNLRKYARSLESQLWSAGVVKSAEPSWVLEHYSTEKKIDGALQRRSVVRFCEWLLTKANEHLAC